MQFSGLAKHASIKPLTLHGQSLNGPVLDNNSALESRAIAVAAEYLNRPRTFLVVTPNYERALQWQARLGVCGVDPDFIYLLPSGLSALFEDAAPETTALSDRLGALDCLIGLQPGIVVATPQAALERTLPKEMLADSRLHLKQGMEVDVEALAAKLARLGYERSEPVRVPSQFTVRGGIVDIFPSGTTLPYRLEFWGDEIESIRIFDPMTQSSKAKVDELEILPFRETLPPIDPARLDHLLDAALAHESALLEDEAASKLAGLVAQDKFSLDSGKFFDRIDLYRPFLYPDSDSATTLVNEEGVVVLDEPLEIEVNALRSEEELDLALIARHERGEILKLGASAYVMPPYVLGEHKSTWALSAMNSYPDWLESSTERDVDAQSLANYRGQPRELGQAISNWITAGMRVVIATDQPTRAKAVLAQIDIFPHSELPDQPGSYILEGNLAGGFISPKAQLAVVTDMELFGVGRLKLAQRKFNEGLPIASSLDLVPGDFVVHINFGIGVYKGLETRTQDGIAKEYLRIDYKEPDRLFVPADQLDRIQKYSAPGEVAPKVNKLSGSEWKKSVSAAREDARAFARDLIRLYAKRKAVERDRYNVESGLVHELEATFPWAETPSQLEAIEDVKRDLSQPYPMDRLICGDVGFGKTEVAIRAAFTAVNDGRQVAVLCPTTILSEQHFRSFNERLAPFEVNLALLNRFRTARERREVLEGLEDGSIDVVIGTHALLSTELKFKDLGLVVVDEEQKFGVKHKESLKQLRTAVDVLTLSATPIPRTLSMSLMHVRQMSVIEDPPPGRLPVRTYIRPYSDSAVREAILRELARGGQVYYVFNRVRGIQHIAEKVRKLVPSARIAVAHGQMQEAAIEPVMIGFIAGEIDVLIATTIIENGLDISNANTMIVENADNFGLAQLYQLRGRVGRSDRQAYALMLYESAATLSDLGMQRLEAIQQFSQLGAGYSLAMRDLQMRGAGDLLGAKQSGDMNAVGFDLYARLIDSEVQLLRSIADGSDEVEVEDPLAGLEPLPPFDIPVAANIPPEYIEHDPQRLYYYQAIMSSRSGERLHEISEQMRDRYGRQPQEVERIFEIMRLRIRAREIGVTKLSLSDGKFQIQMASESMLPLSVARTLYNQNLGTRVSGTRIEWPFDGALMPNLKSLISSLETTLRHHEPELQSLDR